MLKNKQIFLFCCSKQIRKKEKSGMTIVEVLVASLLLSIILLGSVKTEIKSIISTEYSNKVNVVSSAAVDFTNIFVHYVSVEDTDAQKLTMIDNFKNGGWDGTRPTDINKCYSEQNLDDATYCDDELMAKFLTSGFVDLVKETVPDAKFNFNDCSSSANMCLMVSWNGTLPEETVCGSVVSDCVLIEIAKK